MKNASTRPPIFPGQLLDLDDLASALGALGPASLTATATTTQGVLKRVTVTGVVSDQNGAVLGGTLVEVYVRATLGAYASHTVTTGTDCQCLSGLTWALVRVRTDASGAYAVQMTWSLASAASWTVTAGHTAAPVTSSTAFP